MLYGCSLPRSSSSLITTYFLLTFFSTEWFSLHEAILQAVKNAGSNVLGTRPLNLLHAIDAYMNHATFSLWCHFWRCPWDLGSAPAERVGQGEVSEYQHWVQVTWLLLGFAVESPWLALGGLFLSSFAQMGLDNSLLAMWHLHFWQWISFHVL